MMELLQVSLANLLSPMILFFALGLLAGSAKSDLAVPEPISKALSLYLMLSIGFRGGVEIVHSGGMSGSIVAALIAGVTLSFTVPVIAYLLLRVTTRLDGINAAAVSAHYGSVSVVTFVAAIAFLGHVGVPYEGYVVAMLAVMETPAIVSGLLLARRASPANRDGDRALLPRRLLHEVLLSGSVILLIGSFVIGWVTGDEGMKALAPVVETPFKGVLAIFLLDMGLLTSRRLADLRKVGVSVFGFALYMPLVGGAVGLLAGFLMGLSIGGTTLVAVLTASASYIVVPAAMRLALPQANPSIYVTLSLGITFPFNIAVGTPLYYTVARAIAGG